QNGVSNVDALEQGLGGRFEVARGMVLYNVAYLGDGRFHKGVAGDLYAEQRAGTRALADRIGSGPAALKLSDDMLGLAWGKLLINLNNAVNALSGRTLIEELKQRDYRRVFAAAMREGLELLERAEIEPAAPGPTSPTSSAPLRCARPCSAVSGRLLRTESGRRRTPALRRRGPSSTHTVPQSRSRRRRG